MSKISLLSKNAYLSIYVSDSFIYSHLAYSHYDIGRSYVLKDVTLLPTNLHSSELYDYWLDFFQNIERKWNWEIFCKRDVCVDLPIKYLRDFVSEGEGVSGCSVKISEKNQMHERLLGSLEKLSMDLDLTLLEKEEDADTCRIVKEYLGYDDCIYLDLNLKHLQMFRIQKEGELLEFHYKWDNMSALMEMLESQQYLAFVSKHVNPKLFTNLWANFLTKQTLTSSSEVLQDFVRAYITIQLFSVFNSQNQMCRDFGIQEEKNIVWLTGDLLKIPSVRMLIVSIIDGLQLNGTFDVCIDNSSVLRTFGKDFVKGRQAENMIFTRESFLPKFSKVLIPSIDLKVGEKQVVFNGRMRNIHEELGVPVTIMSSEFSEISPTNSQETVLYGELGKKVFLEDSKEIEFSFWSESIAWDRVFFDARFKPVIYGPRAKDNNLKFNVWFPNEYSV